MQWMDNMRWRRARRIVARDRYKDRRRRTRVDPESLNDLRIEYPGRGPLNTLREFLTGTDANCDLLDLVDEVARLRLTLMMIVLEEERMDTRWLAIEALRTDEEVDLITSRRGMRSWLYSVLYDYSARWKASGLARTKDPGPKAL